MDPRFDGVWSANEIEMVKSLILSRHSANNGRCSNSMNDKHTGIVDELREMFPMKDKKQVIDMYVDLVVEMINGTQISNLQPPMVVSNDSLLVGVNNSGVSGVTAVKNPGVTSVGVPQHGYLTGEIKKTKRILEEQRHRKVVVPQQERSGRFWTMEEHRNFLRGLRVYGRGDWKSISRDFVPTKTAVQVSSHAQKYFRRQESTTKKLRYSINDVGLYDAEPWAQNNTNNYSSWEPYNTFTSNAYNPYSYGGFGGQLPSMDIPTQQVYSPFQSHVTQASSCQTVNWNGVQQGSICSSASPMMEGDGTTSQMAWTNYY